jgi:hypothetical protein
MAAEQLLLINPRRKKRRAKKRSRVRAKRRRVAAGGYRVRRRRVKNPRSHKRRRSSFKMRRRRHRNPIGLSTRGIMHSVIPAGVGALGAVALDIAWGYGSSYLPASLQTGMLATVAKLAGAFGLGMIAGKVVGREKGKLVTAGAVTVILYQATKQFAHSAAPSIPGLGAYMTPNMLGGLGASNPAAFVRAPMMLPSAGMGRVGAYMQNSRMAGLSGAMDGMFD